VNDPPTLVRLCRGTDPGCPEAQIGERVVFDENTTTFPESIRFYRIRFGGTDSDNVNLDLNARILSLVNPLEAAVFVCGPKHLTGGVGKKDCSDGYRLTTIEDLPYAIEPENAMWEISIIGYPHWNGPLRLEFEIRDLDIGSIPGTFHISIRPINDIPSIVASATSVAVEYYEQRAGTAEVLTRVKPSGRAGESASFTISDALAEGSRLLQGKSIIAKSEGTQQSAPPEIEGVDPENLVIVYRLKTKLQDIDFFFEKSLNLTAHLLSAEFVRTDFEWDVKEPATPTTKRAAFIPEQYGPCTYYTPFDINCQIDIVSLNAWLQLAGFPIKLDDGVESAVALFLLGDLGNVDYLDRPLFTGFTIEFYKPEEELATPIAAVVILPVIAAATAAAIAAAWILLGQRASDYAGASFDAFAVTTATNGHRSPLYDDKGREVNSPLYTGTAPGAGGTGFGTPGK
jgi:hypothetical protein